MKDFGDYGIVKGVWSLYTPQKWSFSLRISSLNKLPGDLVTFTEEILNRKLHYLCSDRGFQDELIVKKKRLKGDR